MAPFRRAAFTLVETIVATAITLVVAAVVVQTVSGALDQARVDLAVTRLNQLRDRIILFDSITTRYPRFLTYLGTYPAAGSWSNSCGYATNNWRTVNWTSWRNADINTKFFPVNLPATGLDIGIGVVSTEFRRAQPDGTTIVTSPSNSNTALGTLYLAVPSVSASDAAAVNRRIDGLGDDTGVGTANATGAIRYDAGNTVTLYLLINMVGC